ncbi:hypothetical protein [Nocardiopsis metallicus]|uniref:Uncharacterized protein n=1 Tax=Nocardiopsis metallicus TaxID=179819 RepID=A0A840WHW8_9ACTN|nr:hypothetical protein [Nocardiopsis metallicus]MBB5491505.1 hypothetical protein [Nocardiopsis metallicus]
MTSAADYEPSPGGLALRARVLVFHDDPRIKQELAAIPESERPASPDEAYFQAALVVARHDAKAEMVQREQRAKARRLNAPE